MDLPTGERLLPWDPIPRESNVYMEVGVCRVEERAGAEGTWRLRFHSVSAYRRLPVEAQAGAHLIALRAAHEQCSLPTPATYEVVRSRWLREAVSPDHGRPRAVRHFVIAASYVAYDIAAEWCEVEALGDAEQACADG